MHKPPLQWDDWPTSELVNILVTCRDEDDVDSAYWNAMRTLHLRGTGDVFEAARSLCESSCPLEQRIGCDMLAQLGCPGRPFVDASLPLVASIVKTTDDLDALARGLYALGWLGDPRGVDFALPHLSHPDSDIRYCVTHALTALEEDPRSIAGLIILTRDSCPVVRDWATFGLGSQTEQDTPAIRDALVARLGDSDDIVRGEALVGLAKRQDERVVEPLLQALESGIYENQPNNYAMEALDEFQVEKYPQFRKWQADS